MITTNITDGGNFYVYTRDPFGEWSEPVWVEQSGIDPSLFFDADGKVYLTSTYMSEPAPPDEIEPAAFSWGIQQSQIDLTTGNLLSQPRPIWSGTGGKWPEGPHLYKIGDYYYLMIAEGGTDYTHMETIVRGPSLWGPWQSCPHNPILTHRSYQSPFQGLGHADLIEAHDGSWWLVCLGFRPLPGYPPCYHLGRETFLAPVMWNDRGWPVVGQNGHLRVEMEGPSLAPLEWEQPPVRDDFDQPVLDLCWNFLGHPRPEDWSLTERPGVLRLLGNAARLDDGPPVIFVGRRQEHFDCAAAARLDFEPAEEGEEAGLTVWMNPLHHYDLLVTRQNGQRRVVVRRRIGSLAATVAGEPVEAGPVTLAVRADRQNYTFGFSLNNAEPLMLTTAETRYLSTEVASGFTGVYVAMYATGSGQASQTPAFFDWFDYIAKV